MIENMFWLEGCGYAKPTTWRGEVCGAAILDTLTQVEVPVTEALIGVLQAFGLAPGRSSEREEAPEE